MADDRMLEKLGTDAVKWAREFAGLWSIEGHDPHWTEALMTTWFANAIEAGVRQGLVS